MPESVAIRLKGLRERLMSQDELSHASGVPRATIQRIEAGRSHDYRDLEAITKVLGTTPAALWEPPKPSAALSSSAITGPLSAKDAAVIIGEIANLSVAQRGFLLAILFRDESLADTDALESLASAQKEFRKGG